MVSVQISLSLSLFFFQNSFCSPCMSVIASVQSECPSHPRSRMSSKQWWQLTSTMCDVPHVEFLSQGEVKQSHMHAKSSIWQKWMGVDMVIWGWPWSQLLRNLLLSTTSHIYYFTTSSCDKKMTRTIFKLSYVINSWLPFSLTLQFFYK